MIRALINTASTTARVARGEGLGSVARRGSERIEEAIDLQARITRGLFTRIGRAPLLNVLATPPSSRLGGLQIQLKARLREERALREVAFLHRGVLEVASCAWRSSAYGAPLDRAIANALARTGARAIVIEGTAGVPIDSLLKFDNVILAVHDLSLMGEPSAQQLLRHARAVIFPSAFLRDRHRAHFDLPHLAAHVIEPGTDGAPIDRAGGVRHIAYAGSVKRHKGGHLLPEIIAAFPRQQWHIFGGGDEDLLRTLRHLPDVVVHGYYRAGALPALLARHDIGLALLPSIVPESYSLTLSECWLAGVPAVAFNHGAHAERIARDGGGWLAPLDEGSAGIVTLVRRWLAGELTTVVPTTTASPRDAALAHVALYRSLGVVGQEARVGDDRV
jgi:glycosyltransferase involved in cell wall biosynthesis